MAAQVLASSNGSPDLWLPDHDPLLEAARYVATPQPPAGSPAWKDWLFELARSDDIARVALRLCGVSDPPSLRVSFPSPLPLGGQAPAFLMRGDRYSEILLVDPRLANSERGKPATITLPEVYASCMRGKLLRLQGATAAAWAQRMLIESGVLTADDVLLPPLPDGEPDGVVRLHETIEHIFAVRWMRDPAPVPLSHRFLNNWSGQGTRQIAQAMRRLPQLGIIHEADKCKPTKDFPMALFDRGPCAAHVLDQLWRQPAGNPVWQCSSCEDRPASPEIELWTPDRERDAPIETGHRSSIALAATLRRLSAADRPRHEAQAGANHSNPHPPRAVTPRPPSPLVR